MSMKFHHIYNMKRMKIVAPIFFCCTFLLAKKITKIACKVDNVIENKECFHSHIMYYYYYHVGCLADLQSSTFDWR